MTTNLIPSLSTLTNSCLTHQRSYLHPTRKTLKNLKSSTFCCVNLKHGHWKVFSELSSKQPAVEQMSESPTSVLFVCWGNICRSPTAEAVFSHIVESKGLSDKFRIDSAGTISYHEGEPADSRMKKAALKRGIKLISLSRPIRRSDFQEFDIILAMDRKNLNDITSAFQTWNNASPLPEGSLNKVKLMCSYSKKFDVDEVPDPYYGGPEGFEKVLDLLDDACENLLDSLLSK